MLLMRQRPRAEQARLTSLHEVGHYMVALKLGFACGDIAVKLTDGVPTGNATTIVALPVRDLDHVVKYLKDRIAVLYAGAIAQNYRKDGDISEAVFFCLKDNGASDDGKIADLRGLLRNILHADTVDETQQSVELTALNGAMLQKSLAIVEETIDAIQAVATVLYNRFKNSGYKDTTLTAAEIMSRPEVKAHVAQEVEAPPALPGS